MNERILGGVGSWLVTRSASAVAVGALVLATGACATVPLSELARAKTVTEFSQKSSCSPDRVSVDVEPQTTTPPPAGLAADPAKLAAYQQQMAAEHEAKALINAHGCGQVATYLCADQAAGDAMTLRCQAVRYSKLGLTILRATRAVDRIEPGSLAERFGFHVGDVLVEIDHQHVGEDTKIFTPLEDPQSPGHVVTVQRGSAKVDVTVPRI